MKILSKIKALWVVLEFAFTVFVIIILMFLFNKFNSQIRKAWAKTQRFLIGYKIKIIGKPNKEANMLLLNHQSLLDIVVLEDNFPGNIAWIAKKELGDIPFFGSILSLPKMIAVDRDSKKSLIKLFKDVKDRLDSKRVIAMFPEGTRGDGNRLLKFKSGAKVLSEKLKLKVQPIVIVNSRKVMDSKSLTSKFGTIKVIYLDLVDTSKENWYKNLREDMSKVLSNELNNNISNR